jgi:1-acyl-sn-glycerol-3-phosphate acyltransferase
MQKPIAADSAASTAGMGSLVSGVDRGWRIVRTAVSFLAMGFLSLVLALVVIPVLRMFPGSTDQKELRSQLAVHWFVRAFMRGAAIMRLCRIRVEGAEKLRQPGLLVVANHPSLIDSFPLLCCMPQADCVLKGSHLDNPFLGPAARGAGYIPNWDGPTLVAECVDHLVRGRSIIIFPEGTRSPVGELGPFARGAAHIALRSGRDLVPVTIDCDPATLYRGKAWWDVPSRMITLSIRVGDPILIGDVANLPISRARAARAVTATLREYFVSEMANASQS